MILSEGFGDESMGRVIDMVDWDYLPGFCIIRGFWRVRIMTRSLDSGPIHTHFIFYAGKFGKLLIIILFLYNHTIFSCFFILNNYKILFEEGTSRNREQTL